MYSLAWVESVSHRRSQYEANRGTRLGKILPNTVDFYFFIRLIILEDFIRLISYNGPCVRLGCSFFLATALVSVRFRSKERGTRVKERGKNGVSKKRGGGAPKPNGNACYAGYVFMNKLCFLLKKCSIV